VPTAADVELEGDRDAVLVFHDHMLSSALRRCLGGGGGEGGGGAQRGEWAGGGCVGRGSGGGKGGEREADKPTHTTKSASPRHVSMFDRDLGTANTRAETKWLLAQNSALSASVAACKVDQLLRQLMCSLSIYAFY
jgi:hypothetical protein